MWYSLFMVNRRILEPVIRESCTLGKGYYSHIRRFEKPCENCLNQYNEKNKARYHKNIEKEKDRSKRYRENNKEKIKAKRKSYYLKNKNLIKQKRDQFRKDNPDAIKSFNNARRAYKKNAKHEKYTVEDLIFKYGNICHICNKKIDLSKPRKMGKTGWEEGLHIDHLIPISKGGDDIIENVRPSHGKCNIAKGSSIL